MSFNIIIKNGHIVNGTGNLWFHADLGIKDDKIAAIGNLSGEHADRTIDASGLVVSPGFIDIHAHTDVFHIINPTGDSFIMQGVTTNLIGNCGGSVSPMSKYQMQEYEELVERYGVEIDWSRLSEYFERLKKRGTSLNVASLVGNGTVRMAAMGMEKRPPTEGELGEMKRLVSEAMEDGAFGLSTGLWYSPSGYADIEEVIELSKVAAKYGGIYATHMRSEENQLIEALNETIEIGEKARIPVEVSHFKSAGGKKNFGKIKEAIELIWKARKRGVDVTCDVYSWTASSTGLSAYLPYWVHEGGDERIIERLMNPEIRAKIKKDMIDEPRVSVESIGWENLMISHCPKHAKYQGKNIAELAKEKGVDPYDFAFDLLVDEEVRVGLVVFEMEPKDVAMVIKSPLSMMVSDGYALAPRLGMEKDMPHPRSYGNFVNVLQKYVREDGILTMEEAVRKMTSMPAQRLGINDRGLLRAGNYADIVVFDPDTVGPRATYLKPHQFPVGVKLVIVNGVITVDNGKHTGATAGKVIRNKAHAKS